MNVFQCPARGLVSSWSRDVVLDQDWMTRKIDQKLLVTVNIINLSNQPCLELSAFRLDINGEMQTGTKKLKI